MKKVSVISAVLFALAALYVVGRCWAMETPGGNFSQFTVWIDDLDPSGATSVEWRLFRDFDFPTGKCEKILLDIPMTAIGMFLLACSILFTIIGCCLGRFKDQSLPHATV